MQLVCPAGSLPALKAAVDNGADAVYIGFKDDTNARHFSGLNFNDKKALKAMQYARARGVKIYVAINTYAQPKGWKRWQHAVDTAAELHVDALIIADIAVLEYAAKHYPNIPRHLSVQGSCTNAEALKFYQREFAISRAVLPRVLSLDQVAYVAEQSPVDLEVFGFGSLCIMAEGRCHLSSYVTDQSPNNSGVCSPAKDVRWTQTEDHLESRLNNILIDRYQAGETAGYPTLCKGRFAVARTIFHALEEPVSLNTLDLIPQLCATGIKAIKLEGRQRSPAYVAQVVSVWRQALDNFAANPDNFSPEPKWLQSLANISEGSQTTLGAYHRKWQ